MSPALIELYNISHSYRNGPLGSRQMVLKHCTLSIGEEESVGLMGPSGSGKSTLARILAGLERPEQGSIRFRGQDIDRLDRIGRREFRRSVQMLFQDPGGCFHPARRMGDSIRHVLDLHGYPANGQDKQIFEVISRVGLTPDILSRYPDQVSGGQAQRLALARILLVRPRLIILDEPTSGLDLSVQAQILHLLREVGEREKTAFLLISHHPEVIRFMTSRSWVIRDSELRSTGMNTGSAGKGTPGLV